VRHASGTRSIMPTVVSQSRIEALARNCRTGSRWRGARPRNGSIRLHHGGLTIREGGLEPPELRGIDNGNIECNIDGVNMEFDQGPRSRCMSAEVVFPSAAFTRNVLVPGDFDPLEAGCFFGVKPNNVKYYDDAELSRISRSHLRHGGSSTAVRGYPQMSAPYSGLPAATSVEQSIIFAQLELLRRLDPARVQAARAVLLRN